MSRMILVIIALQHSAADYRLKDNYWKGSATVKKFSLIVSLCMALLLVSGATASAFSDLPQGADRDKILALQERGIISGYGDSFKADKTLTNAEGIHLIVKTTDLSLAAYSFFKEPLARDYFERADNDAWYAQSLIIAQVNGLGLPRDLDPQAAMTREAYAHYLLTALLLKGDYAFTKMFFSITDEAQLNPDYMNSLQLLLNGKIITLPEDGKFRPKDMVTRQEAAVWAYNTLSFIEVHNPPAPGSGAEADQVAQSVEAVNADVNKVTLSWGEKPNAGYSIRITGVVFKDQTAEVHYKLNLPEEGKMYAEVITTPTASTYVSSAYKAVPVLDK